MSTVYLSPEQLETPPHIWDNIPSKDCFGGFFSCSHLSISIILDFIPLTFSIGYSPFLFICLRIVTPRIEIFCGCLTDLNTGLGAGAGVTRLQVSKLVVRFVRLEEDFTALSMLVELTGVSLAGGIGVDTRDICFTTIYEAGSKPLGRIDCRKSGRIIGLSCSG
jgi:hypothetical protein